MNIQGIGQSYSAYSSSGMQGMRGMQGGGFDPSSISADKIIKKEDINLDGVLSADETRLPTDMFSKTDKNSDGTLSVDELEKMLANGPPAGGGMGGMMSMGGMISKDDTGIEPMSIESLFKKEPSDRTQNLSSGSTTTQDAVIKAYQQAIQSFLLNYSGDSSGSTLTSLLNTVA